MGLPDQDSFVQEQSGMCMWIQICLLYTSIGPEGGDGGGTVIAQGTPEEVAQNPASYTGKYVKKYLEQKNNWEE